MHETVNEIGNLQYYGAIIIFLLAYAFIISEKINRAILALAGALLMVIFGIVDLHSALHVHIEWGTITLLIGMMILVNITSKSGVFEYVAIKAAKVAKGQPIQILLLLSLLTAVGSAFLDNVTTVLLIVPVTLSVTGILQVNPLPFLISEILFANIGGTATLVGDPPNIMIGSANPHLTFNQFLVNLAPVVIIIAMVTLGLLYLLYRRSLTASQHNIDKLLSLNEKDYIKDMTLLKKSVTVLLFTIAGFMLHSILPLDAAVVALAGATILMLITVKSEHEVEQTLAGVEWVTIFFFAGLFVLVGGLKDIGLLNQIAEKIIEITQGNINFAATLILWVSGIASATIDNIPFVATMIPMIQDLGTQLHLAADSSQLDVVWWALALGACLGGNGTILGASANVIVVGLASKNGYKITYVDFLKIGAVITLISLVIAHIFLFLRFMM